MKILPTSKNKEKVSINNFKLNLKEMMFQKKASEYIFNKFTYFHLPVYLDHIYLFRICYFMLTLKY